jgi:hypothetical protein
MEAGAETRKTAAATVAAAMTASKPREGPERLMIYLSLSTFSLVVEDDLARILYSLIEPDTQIETFSGVL